MMTSMINPKCLISNINYLSLGQHSKYKQLDFVLFQIGIDVIVTFLLLN